MKSNPVHIKPFSELSSLELYYILKSRQDIFILDQREIYTDLDEKDLYALHFWIQGPKSHEILSYLRLIVNQEQQQASIGRVLTAFSHRKQGLAQLLLKKAVDLVQKDYPTFLLTLDAQSNLLSFYQRLGFIKTGPAFYYSSEESIAHIPMIYTG